MFPIQAKLKEKPALLLVTPVIVPSASLLKLPLDTDPPLPENDPETWGIC